MIDALRYGRKKGIKTKTRIAMKSLETWRLVFASAVILTKQ